jgi:hypothetical protein
MGAGSLRARGSVGMQNFVFETFSPREPNGFAFL